MACFSASARIWLLLWLSGATGETEELVRLRAELQRTRAQLESTTAENQRLRSRNVLSFPRVLHQTGPSEMLPDRYAPYVKSWIYNNPGWHYRSVTTAVIRRAGFYCVLQILVR